MENTKTKIGLSFFVEWHIKLPGLLTAKVFHVERQ